MIITRTYVDRSHTRYELRMKKSLAKAKRGELEAANLTAPVVLAVCDGAQGSTNGTSGGPSGPGSFKCPHFSMAELKELELGHGGREFGEGWGKVKEMHIPWRPTPPGFERKHTMHVNNSLVVDLAMLVASDVMIMSASSLSLLAANIRLGSYGVVLRDARSSISASQYEPEHGIDPIVTISEPHASRWEWTRSRFRDELPSCELLFMKERPPVCPVVYLEKVFIRGSRPQCSLTHDAPPPRRHNNPTTTQPHNHTTTQPHNHTTTQQHNPITLSLQHPPIPPRQGGVPQARGLEPTDPLKNNGTVYQDGVPPSPFIRYEDTPPPPPPRPAETSSASSPSYLSSAAVAALEAALEAEAEAEEEGDGVTKHPEPLCLGGPCLAKQAAKRAGESQKVPQVPQEMAEEVTEVDRAVTLPDGDLGGDDSNSEGKGSGGLRQLGARAEQDATGPKALDSPAQRWARPIGARSASDVVMVLPGDPRSRLGSSNGAPEKPETEGGAAPFADQVFRFVQRTQAAAFGGYY